jgi:hypothetical protein
MQSLFYAFLCLSELFMLVRAFYERFMLVSQQTKLGHFMLIS